MRIFSLQTVLIFLLVNVSCAPVVTKQQEQQKNVLPPYLANYELGQITDIKELVREKFVIADLAKDAKIVILCRDKPFYVTFYYAYDPNARNDFIANGLCLLVNNIGQIVSIICFVEDYRKRIPFKRVLNNKFTYKEIDELEDYSKEYITRCIDENNMLRHQELINDMMLKHRDYVIASSSQNNGYYVEFSDRKTSWIFAYNREKFLIVVSFPGIEIDF